MKKKKNKMILLVALVTCLLLMIVGVTFAFFNYNKIGTNQQLVLGDIYMHYKESSPGIQLNSMLPTEMYTLNTSEEAVNQCVSYIINTYGDSWNGMSPHIQPSKSKENNSIAKFMELAVRSTYREYCSGDQVSPPIVETKNRSQSNSAVKPMVSMSENETFSLISDVYNGVLTKTDIAYFEENGILINNIKNLPYFEFTVEGKNTHPKGNILYNIQVAKGNAEEGKTRIEDKFLKFRLIEVTEGKEKILVDHKNFQTINNTTIYTNIIPKQTNVEMVHTYRLYMWIDGAVKFGNAEDANYSIDEWNNLFASIKVNVNGEYSDAENLSEKIKNKVGTEGVVAVNTSGMLYDGIGEIREYRYSGIGNYCTYTDGTNDYNLSVEEDTCPPSACSFQGPNGGTAIVSGSSDGFILQGKSCAEVGGTEVTLKTNEVQDSGLRNYILFNDEMYRIVGVFDGKVKILKDTPLLNASYTMEKYTSATSGNEYLLKEQTQGTKYGYFYYNAPDTLNGNLNDWTQAGALYYLNEETGYYGSIKESFKNLIDETTYYLGNVSIKSDNYMIDGTPIQVYSQERGSVICGSDVSMWSQNSSCNIWYGNQASWTGKIGLLYPSDYGYASNSSNWTKNMNEYYANGGSLNNWMFNTDAFFSWFLSPSSVNPPYVLGCYYDGRLYDRRASINGALRPTFNLKSEALVVSGDGSYNDPYRLLEK